jgi:hypothetical protein
MVEFVGVIVIESPSVLQEDEGLANDLSLRLWWISGEAEHRERNPRNPCCNLFKTDG